MPTVRAFKGLNNLSDAITLGLDWLLRADNINIGRKGRIARRDGYALALSATNSGAYSTRDFQRAYIVAAGSLKRVMPDMTTRTLATGLSTLPMHWDEVNGQVFYTNGTDSGIITVGDEVLEWAWPVPGAPTVAAVTGSLPAGQYQVVCTYLLADGRETGSGEVAVIDLEAGQALQISAIPQVAGLSTLVYIAPANSQVFQFAFTATGTAATWSADPNALGADLTTHQLEPLPPGATLPTHWMGRMCVAEYLPAKDVSVIWISEALAPHLFDQSKGFVMVPGKAVLLAAADKTLVIGTDRAIHAWDGTTLAQLAPYGAIPGWSVARDNDTTVIFWTARGACRAMPFQNLTDNRISVAPGVSAGAAVIETGGEKRYVVALQAGGASFNSRS